MCWSSCSTTSATRSSGATGPTSRRRTSIASRPAVSGSRTSTPRRCARRPARACSPAATTTRTRWGESPISPSASRATGDACRARTASCPRSSRRNGYVPMAVGKWHLTPEDETHAAAPATRGRAAGLPTLVRVPRRRDASVRADAVPGQPRRPTAGASGGRLSPQRRSRRPRHPLPRRAAIGRARQALLPLLRHRRVPLAASRTGGIHRALPRPVRRRLGRVAREDVRSPTRARPPAIEHAALAAPVVGSGVGHDGTGGPARRGAVHGVLRRVLVARRRADRSRDRLRRATGERDNTLVVLISDNGASSEGGAQGSINDARLWNGAPASAGELRRRVDELGTQTAHNNYPWGWTMAGNTPFRRWKREVHEGGIADPCIISWPARIAAATGSATSSRTRSTCCRRSSSSSASRPRRDRQRRAGADRRHELRLPPRRRRRSRTAHDAVLRDARQPRSLPRRLEGGDVQAARPDVRRRPRPRCAVRGRRVGAVSSGRRSLGVQRRRRAASGRAREARGAVVGGGRALQRACRSTIDRSRR